MSNTYYQDELRYLRDVGPEFAQANPEIARSLADRGSDPDVERLLEGMAFLSGRIRQKLDDELPELTASMMDLLWPHYLRSVPSMSILEYQPDIDALRGPLHVEAGSEYSSVPIDGTRCKYRASWPIVLRPWSLKSVRLETEAAKPVRLVLTLEAASAAVLEDLELDSVRFHLSGDPATASTLYALLAAHVDHVAVSDGSSRHDRAEVLLPSDSVVAAGMERARAVLPFSKHSFPGYRLLQEYFAFKDRFLFVNFLGLDRAVTQLGTERTLELAVTLNRRLESFPLVSLENIRLHCAPVINLFEQAAEPIRLRHDRVRYLIRPVKAGIADHRHAEPYSVDQVFGVSRSGEYKPREYPPFYSFTHMAGTADAAEAYYQTHVTANVVGGDPRLGTDTYLSVVPATPQGQLPQDETISVELTCTNRNLPGELRAGDICEPTDSSPSGVTFRNLKKPTATICPPLGKGLHWRLISHMSLNFVSLMNVEHFRELLRVYDFQQEHDVQLALAHQRMLNGIVSLRSEYKERMIRGAPIRGLSVSVELNEDHFAGEGDAYLFATVLDCFIGLYVTLNAYSQLTVRFTRSGQVHVFSPRSGDQCTPAEPERAGGHDG